MAETQHEVLGQVCDHGQLARQCEVCQLQAEVETLKLTVAQRDAEIKELLAFLAKVHEALCPGQSGTWQDRARQAVDAARAVAKERDEAA